MPRLRWSLSSAMLLLVGTASADAESLSKTRSFLCDQTNRRQLREPTPRGIRGRNAASKRLSPPQSSGSTPPTVSCGK